MDLYYVCLICNKVVIDLLLENETVEIKGYKIIRFLAYVDRLPTKEELVNAVNYLLQTNKKFIQIELT